MKKFAVLGDYESVVMYKCFGWEVIYTNLKDKSEIIEKFNSIKNLYERIFLTEEVYEVILEKYPEIEKLSSSVIPLPGIRGSKNLAKQKYKKLAAIATGIKLEE
ncbi:MAG: V-type ATP synthase subunit F [Endomicrobiia bacterium]